MSESSDCTPIAADPDVEDGTPRRGLRLAAAGVAVVTVMAAGFLLGAGAGSAGTAPTDASSMAPMAVVFPDGVLDLASVSGAIAVHYQHAAANTDVYEQVRCYCGCEAAFDHRTLADCFIRADGGWEAHASGCGICIAEAVAIQDHLDAGTPIPEIVDDIDSRFGDMTPNV